MFEFQDGFYADVRIEDRYSARIRYRNGAMEESTQSSVKKAFIRVYDGKMWYYSSVCDTGHIQAELDKLYAMATPDADILSSPVVSRLQANKETVMKFSDCCVKDVPIGQKRKLLTDAMAACVPCEYCKMYSAAYQDRYSVYEFYNSKGAALRYDFQVCGARLSAAFAAGEKTLSDSDADYLRGADRLDRLNFTRKGADEFIAEAVNYLLHAKPVEAGVYPVVLSPMTAGVFAHESFGHKSEADFMIGDETMKREWALGKKVGADILSIYDSGLEDGSGYAPFDDEGTRTEKTYLIKDGVLTGRLHSAVTAADLNESVTGNARAVSCDFEPIVRMTSTVIGAGTLTKEELFSRIRHGYYIETYKHGSGMSTFTIAPAFAYEIVDGKIGDPVKIAVVSGNVFETLGLIDGLSDRVEISSNAFGGCGKMEQWPLSVSFGGPYVSVSKMNVQ